MLKTFDRGYWVSKLYKYQSVYYWFIYSVYFKTLTYFSAANPRIYLGGMLNERKSDIYSLIPGKYLPKTHLINSPDTCDPNQLVELFDFPFILKPNIGYKGHLVRRIDNREELISALDDFGETEVVAQEFVKEEKEYSIMYYHFPQDDVSGISSLVEKHLPHVTGDGVSTFSTLLENLNNPFLKKVWVLEKFGNITDHVIPEGEIFIVDHIGNYSRGAKFENLNHEIDPELVIAMNGFFTAVGGMNFCRLDVKAESLAHLKKGEFKLLEINGAKSEPLHIYDPHMKWREVISDIRRHWKILFEIVRQNIESVKFPSSYEGIKSWRRLKKQMGQ